jgi:hypothetical protein
MEDWEAYAALEQLRIERPTLWAVLTLGPTTPSRLAKILMSPPDNILHDLRHYKSEGLVTDSENPRPGQPMVWEVTSNLADLYNWRLQKLRDWKLK